MQPSEAENVSEVLRDHLLAPRRSGALEGPDARRAVATNAACDDVLELFGRVADGRLDLRFRARGCWAVLACASLLCERASGLEVDRVARFDAAAEVERAGGVPRPRAHAVRLFERALRELLGALGRSR